MSKPRWHRLTVGILPPDGVEIDADMRNRLERAIGEAVGPWTMTYGFTCEPIEAPTLLPAIDIPHDPPAVKPVRIQLRRAARWNLQEASLAINGLPAKSCARPTIMGNPFGWQTPQLSDHSGRRLAVQDHRAWLINSRVPATMRSKRADLMAQRELVLLALQDYRGHNLACFCGLDQACHVDTILELANP